MTRKFGRNYRLTVYPLDGGAPILITMPFTVSFSVNRDTGSELNTLDIDIYNLSEVNRKRIFHDLYVIGNYANADGSPILDSNGQQIGSHNIILEAGYDNLYRIFYGRIFQASSAREGTNIVTRISARDGNSDVSSVQTYQTLESGQTLGGIFQYLIGQFPTLKIGAIGDFPQVLNRPVALNGNTWDLLKQYSNNQVYVDGGKVYVLKTNEILSDTAIINDSTGLLETPRRCEGYLRIVTLMETGINIGQSIQFQSIIQPEYNGTYKVIGLMHQGVISAAVSGSMRSVFTLLAPNQFKQFVKVNPQ